MSSVQSVERAFAVLKCLAGGPAGVSEVAERVQLPKSTVSRLLSTLHDLGAVEQLGAGGDYRIGHLMVELTAATHPGRSLVAVARPHLVELTEAVGEAAGLSVLDGSDVHYLDQVESDQPVQVRDWTGERVPAHLVSSGLVLLAGVPPAELDAFLDGPLGRATARSMTDPELLRRRVADVRRRGSEWVYEEFVDGINSVAAPVRDAADRIVAAVHAHGPSYRFPGSGRAESIAALVVAAADRISARLAGHVELAAP
ncbi:MAG: IclR family transcriptional regulator [Ilumatobacteraceae bacterium]